MIVTPEVPEDCKVHFSSIEARGYRELRGGQRMRFTYEESGFLQNACRFRALGGWPQS